MPQYENIFWHDVKGRQCAEVVAKNLQLSSADKWDFYRYKLKSGNTVIDVAESDNVSKLEVEGYYDTTTLKANTQYEVLFDIKMMPNPEGFESPVKFTLNGPGINSGIDERLDKFVNFGWVEVRAGRFNTGDHGIGNVNFKMSLDSGNSKKGLVVRGVIIQATN